MTSAAGSCHLKDEKNWSKKFKWEIYFGESTQLSLKILILFLNMKSECQWKIIILESMEMRESTCGSTSQPWTRGMFKTSNTKHSDVNSNWSTLWEVQNKKENKENNAMESMGEKGERGKRMRKEREERERKGRGRTNPPKRTLTSRPTARRGMTCKTSEMFCSKCGRSSSLTKGERNQEERF